MMQLVDPFGRTATDLRVSVTDRCNLHCTYCMPAEGMDWLARSDVLSADEIIRLVQVAVSQLGISKVRFTGGEPLVRPEIVRIVSGVKRLRTASGRPVEVALTTNGLLLPRYLDALVEAGLDRVNISLDTLDRDRYAQLARRDRLDDVLVAVDLAAASGLQPVKLNTVIMRGVNEVDIVPLARFALVRGLELRYIEQMPIGPPQSWRRGSMVPAAEILASLGKEFELFPDVEPRGSAPAVRWGVKADATQPGGRIGIIASVTSPFCADCSRTRLTADGQVRNCLFARQETDLRELLRSGADDRALAQAWMGAHAAKAGGHGFDGNGFAVASRTMSAIGG